MVLITTRLLEDFNKLCDPLVTFDTASFVFQSDDPSVENVDCFLVRWTSQL